MMTKENKKTTFTFGKLAIDPSQIFYKRKFVYAFTNLKPFLNGHVLLAPTRKEKKFKDLTETEAMEMWISAKNISENLKRYYRLESVQITIQDGEDAGQTIDHCHIHIIPIPKGYSPKEIDDQDRQERTFEEMKDEAEIYQQNFVFP